ncbi:putative structural maintenance of chromosomes protein 4 [Triangularia verruculosa]|uniref:Structural maintenance of chromosomes protein 4 n=1 Tax=Triangularia verruculosa TaxID=2587418 RepID=A0AAN6XMP3_9PEZI|nr:putative structural maintenance of chromosomes protein 4 [Triangularia verruculosa]
MSTRQSRRIATRRNTTIVESSEDELGDASPKVKQEEDEEEEYTPAPVEKRRGGRRRTTTTEVAAAPAETPVRKPRGRPKKSLAPAAPPPAPPVIESTENVDPDQSIASVASAASAVEVDDDATVGPPPSTTKKRAAPADDTVGPPPSTAKKPARRPPKSVAPRASKTPTPAPELNAPTQSPKASVSPSTQLLRDAPLTDITSATNNAPPSSQQDDTVIAPIKPIKPMDTVLEKPMDIMLKSRTMQIPVVQDTGPKPRIVITYLVLTNFKSYAGKQEVGPFHSSFSSVVGPNGSGKSNVIDSLLFVFGFRASKMRQGKISALIHNSAKYPNLEYCEVAVHFREVMDLPGGGHEVIPDSDLVISRKAFRNNSSSYYINGKTSNFTTVTTLLRDRGVDLDHKRFLILQGEVESIAQMKAKAANEHDDGLLEYLEDIIGTSKYKTPIEESAAEVETLNEICLEKSGRVQHVEKEKQSLEDKKNKALAFIRDENELAMKQSALYQLYISQCEDNLAVTDEAISQMQEQLNAELEKHNGSEHIIKQLEKAHSRGNREYEAQEKETQALIKEMAKFEQERVKFEEKKKFLADKRKKLEKTITNSENSAEQADQTIQECAEDIEKRAAEIENIERWIQEEEEELTKIRDSLKGKTQHLSDQIAAKQKSLEPWKEKINQKQSAIAVAESELAILEEKAKAGGVALEEMEAKIVSIQELQEAKAEEFKACQAEKDALKKEGRRVVAELEELAQEEPKFRAKLSNLRQKADEARSSFSATKTQGNVLTALMRMKESGRIDGFHGRLGNLGAIDKKYDVAISTACGQLDNFVTDTVEAGQQCIEYLRKTNLGRGNFMCLDKLRVRDFSPIKTPEDAPRLFDLVQPKDEKFRPAFYHALQDTLVADDLAQANRIAYGAKRWRVVTLAGELIDKSGTMSGGGTTVKKGLMSSKLVAEISKEQVDKVEADRDAFEQRFQEFQEHQRELEARLRSLKEQIPQLDTKMQKINLEIESSARNLVDAQRRIKELSKEHQPSQTDDNRVAVLQKEIAKLNKEIEKLHGETSSVEDEIKELQDKIMEVGGEKLRQQRTKVDNLKEEIRSQNEEVSNAEVRKVKAEKQKVKLEKDHAKASKELEAANRDLERLEEEIENQGTKAEDYTSRVEEAKEALAAKKEELSTLKADLDEKTAELNATRAVEIEMRNKLEENQKVLKETQRQLAYWENKLSKLSLQNIEDLESGRPTQPVAPQSRPKTPGSNDDDEEEEDAEGEPELDAEGDSPMGDATDSDDDEDPAAQLQAEAEATFLGSGRGPNPASNPLELPRYTRDELSDMSEKTLKGEIAVLEEKTQNVNVDLGVLAEYRRRVEEHAARSQDLASAVASRDAAKKRCDDLRRLRLEGFMEGFSTISLRLKEMYQMITMGGNAELELVDSLDPFSEGILFSVMPPKKSWKNISNLSGGEKTLSSLALVFALHHYKPTPLYVMDEIDAALDFRNVSIVANYIKERTKNAQFIVISLRNNMFELAARLVGVYKVNHMTKSVTIENKEYVKGRQQQQQQAQQSGQLQRGGTEQTTTRVFGPGMGGGMGGGTVRKEGGEQPERLGSSGSVSSASSNLTHRPR